MDGGAHHRADAGSRRDPRADVTGRFRVAAAAAPAAAAARTALPHGAARILRRLADPVPPSLARLARVPAAERGAQAHGRASRDPGVGVGAPARAHAAAFAGTLARFAQLASLHE